jgi:hypothetical protein
MDKARELFDKQKQDEFINACIEYPVEFLEEQAKNVSELDGLFSSKYIASLILLGEKLFRTGDFGKAKNRYEEIIRIAERIGYPREHIVYCTALTRLKEINNSTEKEPEDLDSSWIDKFEESLNELT